MPGMFHRQTVFTFALITIASSTACADDPAPSAEQVLDGLRDFYRRTARPDGSFAPGVDPHYQGLSDSAYSDLAAVTYACTIHKTFGWPLPFENQTVRFLEGRQHEDGAFYNLAGTVDAASPEGRTYNTTQGLVALHALGRRPRYNPLPVFEAIVKHDYQSLPAYSTSFFPLAYRCYAQPIPKELDRAIRATMRQADDGYLHDHIAATFHASHYYRLVGEPTPQADDIVARMLRDQKPDGGWLLNMPSRDRHAAFDAVFTLRQEGTGRRDCQEAIARAARWALTCRNPDGGFGHFPGSPSDADAVYFQVGVLVMAGVLKPIDPLPAEPELFSWGHLMPPRDREAPRNADTKVKPAHARPAWIADVTFSPDGKHIATGSGDSRARLHDASTGELVREFNGQGDVVSRVAFSPDGQTLASASFDGGVRFYDAESGKMQKNLNGHRGAVLAMAYRRDGELLATGGIDATVRLWHVASGQQRSVLTGHTTWVNAVAFSPDGGRLVSASSDGTLRVWSVDDAALLRTIEADRAEIRSLAWSSDGKLVAAGIRYGHVRAWNTADWTRRFETKSNRGDVWSVAFSPDNRWLLTCDGDWDGPGQLKVLESTTGEERKTLETAGELLSIAISPRDASIAAGGRDGRLHVWGAAEVLPP